MEGSLPNILNENFHSEKRIFNVFAEDIEILGGQLSSQLIASSWTVSNIVKTRYLPNF